MHHTDDDGHASNQFTDGDPSVPTRPTQISSDMMNAIVNELCNILTNAGVSLVKGTHTQLRDVLMNLKTNQTANLCKKTFVGAESNTAIQATGGDGGNNGGGGSNGNGGTAIVATGGSEQGGHQGGNAINAEGGSGDDGAFAAISAVGGSGGFSSGRGVYAEGGGDGGGGGGIGAEVKGGAGGGAGGGIGLRVSAGDDGGGVYTNKAIHAQHGDVHVDDGKILVDVEGSVITNPAVVTPAPANSWANIDTGAYKGFGYYPKDAMGAVELQGFVDGASATDPTIGTLAAGSRPNKALLFAVVFTDTGTPAIGFVQIFTTGDVDITMPSGHTQCSLNGIRFRV